MAHVNMQEILDPNGQTWDEFVRLNSADQKRLDAILTPHAFRALIRSEKSFEHLYPIFNQTFNKTPMFALTPRGIAPIVHTARLGEKYDLCFNVLQSIMWTNKQVVEKGAEDQSEYINMSMLYMNNAAGKIIGYSTYCRYFEPTMIGEEVVFAFYHRNMRKVALVSIPSEAHRGDFMSFMGGNTVVLPFDKVCSWCGRAAEHFAKCPCKQARYCNADCQHRHWDMHKSECPRAKGA
jgi:hypothetical protein